MKAFILFLVSIGFPQWEADEIGAAIERNQLQRELWCTLAALRKVENGSESIAFGILDDRCKGYRKQAGWAAYQIKLDHQRWLATDQDEPFIEWFSHKYAPIGAKNDPKGLNKNHAKNLRYWSDKINKQFKGWTCTQ
jgi:hypothetical protein